MMKDCNKVQEQVQEQDYLMNHDLQRQIAFKFKSNCFQSFLKVKYGN